MSFSKISMVNPLVPARLSALDIKCHRQEPGRCKNLKKEKQTGLEGRWQATNQIRSRGNKQQFGSGAGYRNFNSRKEPMSSTNL